MHVVTKYPDGIFSWVDLASSDVAAAKAFYQGLFGWESEDMFMPTDDGPVYIYTMFTLHGKNVAGLGPLPAEMQAQGVPSNWTSYVNHSDVDGIAEKISANGGTVIVPAMDVMDSGRMLMAMDPAGAPFGVWQPRNHIGAQVVNMPGALVWNELQSRAAQEMKAFYGAVFDWGADEDGNGYIMYKVGERVQAGSMLMDENWDESIPNNWAVYFMVEDLEAAAQQAAALGATIVVPPTPAGEMGRFAVVSDPTGGIFTIMQFSGPVDLPPGVEA